MKTITLLNSKGGTGKTTVATHLAAGLALAGRRVLLIDADGQGNATVALGLQPAPKFYDLTVRGASWKDSIYPVHPDIYTPVGLDNDGALYCVPGNVETRSIPNNIEDETVLARRVRELDDVIDYIIFDTSPTASLLHSTIHAASDFLLIPTQLEGFSALSGLPDTMQRAENIRRRALDYGLDICRPLGIVPNMYRAGTVTHESVLEHIRENYGPLVWEPIRLRIEIAEASLAKQLIYAYRPAGAASDELGAIVDGVLQSVEGVHA